MEITGKWRQIQSLMHRLKKEKRERTVNKRKVQQFPRLSLRKVKNLLSDIPGDEIFTKLEYYLRKYRTKVSNVLLNSKNSQKARRRFNQIRFLSET